MPTYQNHCPTCQKSCKNAYCYKHNPDTEEKRRDAIKKYRQSDKGREVVKKMNDKRVYVEIQAN